MKYAAVGPISTFFPQNVETNDDLARLNPNWDLGLIAAKTGIHRRHIADKDQTASDLGVEACKKLFEDHQIDPKSIDFLLFCTQTPDTPIPTTSCMMQQRLGLRIDCGALDFNLGCSGFVYGLGMADGLIRTGAVKRVLLVTGETYSKYIDPSDRSLRTIFGDAAAATLIEAHDSPSISGMQYGSDGSGADTLLVTQSIRPKDQALKPRHRHRWPSQLYMDGPELINFAVGSLPPVIDKVLVDSELNVDQVDLYLFHQATLKMLDQLRERIGVDWDKVPLCMENYGNTVSSTIPILIEELRNEKKLSPEHQTVMVGFGVGWSWAACAWKDVLGS